MENLLKKVFTAIISLLLLSLRDLIGGTAFVGERNTSLQP